MKQSYNDSFLRLFCTQHGWTLEREVKFHPKRKWRFDYAIPEIRLGIEIEGGLWIQGAHNRPIKYMSDMEKYREAWVLDWDVIRFSPAEFRKNLQIAIIQRWLDTSQNARRKVLECQNV